NGACERYDTFQAFSTQDSFRPTPGADLRCTVRLLSRSPYEVRWQAKRDAALAQSESRAAAKAPSPLRFAGALQVTVPARCPPFFPCFNLRLTSTAHCPI